MRAFEGNPSLRPKHITAPSFSDEWWQQNDQSWRAAVGSPQPKPTPPAPKLPRPVVTLRQVLEATEWETGVSIAALVGPSKTLPVVFGRFVACFVAVERFRKSQSEVARALTRHPSTVLGNNLRTAERMKFDPVLARAIDAVTSRAMAMAAASGQVVSTN